MERTFDSTRDDAGAVFSASRPKSAASWGAIFAGAVVAAGVSLILLALGSGLGFASVSPWADRGVGATTFTVVAAIWLIAMQWISSIFGGYVAGRLRTRWVGTHAHEIFFRDTAHGLVTWALATLMVAALVASTAASGVGSGVHAVSGVVAAGAQGAMSAGVPTSGAMSYGIDKLFRSTAAMPGDPGASNPRLEASRILANAATTGSVPDADRAYLTSLVAAHTGASDAEAQKRVDDFITSAQQAEDKVKAEADAARKGAAEVSIYTALSLLIGAFIASVSAALGGRLRDQHV